MVGDGGGRKKKDCGVSAGERIDVEEGRYFVSLKEVYLSVPCRIYFIFGLGYGGEGEELENWGRTRSGMSDDIAH